MVQLALPKVVIPKAVTALIERIPYFKREKTGSHMRAHQRHGCCLVAELLITEKGYKIDGLVIEASRGGIRFREASKYVLDRRDVHVVVIIAGNEYPGVIVNVGHNGYGVKLEGLISDEEVERLVAENPTPKSLNEGLIN